MKYKTALNTLLHTLPGITAFFGHTEIITTSGTGGS